MPPSPPFDAADAALPPFLDELSAALQPGDTDLFAQLRFERQRADAAERARAWAAEALAERELQLAVLGEAHRMVVGALPALERDAAELARIRATRAWRWTALLRRWLG